MKESLPNPFVRVCLKCLSDLADISDKPTLLSLIPIVGHAALKGKQAHAGSSKACMAQLED
jgi:hypothetical protein